jgi:inner membrane protein
VGVLGALLARLARRKPIKAGLFAAGIVASHDLLDTLTTGGLGIALLWPFTNRRFFAPWHLIPVSPIGFGFFSYRGLHVVAAEFLISLPFLLYAFWKRKPAANERL